VIQRSFERGEAILEVDAKATAQQLGDELARKPIQGLDLDVTAATANTLELCVVGKCMAASPISSPSGSEGVSTEPAETMVAAKTSGVLKSIRGVTDKDVVAQLNEVTVRGSVLQVVVTFVYQGPQGAAQGEKNQGSYVVHGGHILDYGSGKKYGSTSVDGDNCCSVKAGETKRVQLTFPAPPGAKKVGIYVNQVGTFDDVSLTP
jgi:hypothetical protein